MKAHVVVGSLAFGILLAAGPASAQVVQAGVVFRSGPVAGHVIVGEPGPVAVYPRPRRIVVVERYAPRVVVVERIHVPPGHAYGWRRYGYRPVVVYYDRGRYYDRAFDGRPLRRVEVYQRGGRYYRWDGDDRDHYRDRYREAQRYGWDD
jgi:hypothetical protein